MSVLKKIRDSIKKHQESCYYGEMKDTEEMLRKLWREGKADIVKTKTEDRGNRWTKYEISIYKVESDGETAYFEVEEEVGKTEAQSDGGIMVEEVKPKEIIIIEYVPIDED